jgi:C4-type Zn-finger protein
MPALRQPVRLFFGGLVLRCVWRPRRASSFHPFFSLSPFDTLPPPRTHKHSNNEVSFAGAFGERGTRTTLTVPPSSPAVLSRQLVKADTATATIPELEFEIPAGTQKGCITTLEGLLREAGDKLRALQPERRAANPEGAAAIDAFLEKLDAAAAGETPFTLVLDDPAGNSGVEADGPGDPLVRVEYYDRTAEQAAACGLKPQVRDKEREREA